MFFLNERKIITRIFNLCDIIHPSFAERFWAGSCFRFKGQRSVCSSAHSSLCSLNSLCYWLCWHIHQEQVLQLPDNPLKFICQLYWLSWSSHWNGCRTDK